MSDKRAKVTLVMADGVKVSCFPEQVQSVMAQFSGKPITGGKLPYKSSKDIRHAIQNITGDTGADFVMNTLKANVSNGYGIHSVYSGMNHIIRERYGDDPILVTDLLAKEGVITIRPAKGGVIIDLPKSK